MAKSESVEIFGPENLVLPTRDNRNREPDQDSLGDFPQILTRVDIKKYMLKHRLRLLDATVSPTICHAAGNMGSEQRTRKNDSIDTTQDATTHYPDEKEIQKD